ncbi:MAG: SusC/RagA family TonB-linked outer membrane protein [Prevotella sp.]|nr:SusC/RagA family TonB-linked outer membrane protein [Prevotella sp.]
MEKERSFLSSHLRACLMAMCLLFATAISAQNVTVKGTVSDQNGDPIIGATVKVDKAQSGTVTNYDGDFQLSCREGANLVVSYIGYTTKTVTATSAQKMQIVLEEEATALTEVVVTALGIKKDSRKVGYAISSVDASELIKTASPTIGTALYGKATGVEIKTAPGGATGAISINVRGLSSITGSNQPLIILDGVPIHNEEVNAGDYWAVQRSQSNALTNINPEDIENISILKGAAATAQYGSEGANGVVIITTKTGKGKNGFGVEFNASLTGNWVAYMPEYQTEYGPGNAPQSRGTAYDAEGFVTYTDRNGNLVKGVANGSAYWGPKYDGREVYFYDGKMRKYEAINSNPWSDIFRTGVDQQYNLALTNSNDKGNLRFSYTYLNSLPTQYNSNYDRHNFSLNGTYNVLKNVKLDYSVNYMVENVKNRPYRIARLTANFSGMFGAFDDIPYIRDHTVTTAGYKNRVYNASNHENPAEGWAYSLGCSALVDEYYWNIFGREQFETNNRLIAKIAPSWEIIPGLTLKASLATDLISNKIELEEHTETSTAFGDYSGYYRNESNRYSIVYGDVMAMFDKNLTDKLNLSAYIGWSGRREDMNYLSSGTNGGLSVENWFHLNASVKTPSTSQTRRELLKTAWFGDITLGWDNWAYLEATLRNEKSSTLAKGNRSFWYPSVNASIVISELLKDNCPSWLDYGKVRASYGVVGLAPSIYQAAMGFNHGSASGYIFDVQPTAVGNDAIKPEKTYEWEFGIEGKFLNNRLGFDVAFYHKTIKDQILQTTQAITSGASSILMNVGELESKGLEIALNGTPLKTKDWRIDLRFNIAFNTNKVKKLADGLDRLEHWNKDNGAIYLYSFPGEKMGDIYAYDIATDANGNKIVDSDGFYKMTDTPVKVGNAMPKYTGGFGASVAWKDLFLDFSLSFRKGGAVFNMPYEYLMGRGSIKESLEYHTGDHTYYVDGGKVVPASTAPAGYVLYNDGVILPGVKEDGTPNDIVISNMRYANWTYNWGTDAPTIYSPSVFENTYVKVREIVLGYSLPKSFVEKFRCQNLQLSVYARNPFYIYKNLPIFDAEATDATGWIDQAWIGGSTATSRSFGISLRASF